MDSSDLCQLMSKHRTRRLCDPNRGHVAWGTGLGFNLMAESTEKRPYQNSSKGRDGRGSVIIAGATMRCASNPCHSLLEPLGQW